MIWVIHLSLILFACVGSKNTAVDECGFNQLEGRFYTEASKHGTSLIKRKIDFSFVDAEAIDCSGSKIAIGCAGNNKIQFSRPYWLEATCTEREILFFHEMLHIFGKEHKPPPHIMQAFMLDEKEYVRDREKLLVEAFKF